MSARTACATPGYWTLTATSRPSSQPRAVDLADRGGGDRLLVELSKTSSSVSPSSASITLRMSLKRDLRRRVAQLAELALELLAVLLGHQADVEERHHLPELHRRALHRPQRGDDLLGGLELAALERRLLAPPRRGRRWPRACRAGARPGRPRGRPTRAVRAMREVGMRSSCSSDRLSPRAARQDGRHARRHARPGLTAPRARESLPPTPLRRGSRHHALQRRPRAVALARGRCPARP